MKSILPQSSRLKAYAILLLVTAIWGIASPVIKYTLGGIDAIPFLTYRFGLSAIVGLITFMLHGFKLPKEHKYKLFLFVHALFSSAVSLGLLFFGLQNTTVLEMTIITLAVPLLTSTAGAYFLHEHVTKREKIGMSIALLGTLFTVFEPLFLNGNGELRFSGNILIFLYIVANILPTLLAKRLLRNGVNPSTLVSLSFIVGFLTFLIVSLSTSSYAQFIQTVTVMPISYHLGVFYMAFLSGNLAYYLFNKAQKTIEVGDASVFSYLYPIFSTPLAVLWLGEKITAPFVIGAIIIVTGVFIAEFKGKMGNLFKPVEPEV